MLNLKGKISFLNNLLNLSLFAINFSWSCKHLGSSLSRTRTFPRSKGLIVGTISVDCTTLMSFSSLVVISRDPSINITYLRFQAFINILSGDCSLNRDCISITIFSLFKNLCRLAEHHHYLNDVPFYRSRAELCNIIEFDFQLILLQEAVWLFVRETYENRVISLIFLKSSISMNN